MVTDAEQPISSAQSHQTGVIAQHWNDLPTSLAPKLRAGGLSSSSSSTSLALLGNNGSPSSGSGSSSGSPGSPIDAESFSTVLESLFAAPTILATNEATAMKGRVSKAMDAGSITDDMKVELGAVIDAVLGGRESPKWGREKLVEFMVREKGVAVWGAAMRRLVEGVKRE